MKADEPIKIPLDLTFDHHAGIPGQGTMNSGVGRI
jgi:hypothetical protein